MPTTTGFILERRDVDLFVCIGKKNMKSSAPIGLRSSADCSMMIEHYLFTNGKAHSRAAIFRFAVKTLKQLIDFGLVLLFKTNTIIAKI